MTAVIAKELADCLPEEAFSSPKDAFLGTTPHRYDYEPLLGAMKVAWYGVYMTFDGYTYRVLRNEITEARMD